MPRGVYDRAKAALKNLDPARKTNDEDQAAEVRALVKAVRKKKGRKWSKARRAALSEKMRKSHGRHRLTPTLEAAVLVSKMNDIVLGRIRDNFAPGPLEILVLQAHAVLTTVES